MNYIHNLCISNLFIVVTIHALVGSMFRPQNRPNWRNVRSEMSPNLVIFLQISWKLGRFGTYHYNQCKAVHIPKLLNCILTEYSRQTREILSTRYILAPYTLTNSPPLIVWPVESLHYEVKIVVFYSALFSTSSTEINGLKYQAVFGPWSPSSLLLELLYH